MNQSNISPEGELPVGRRIQQLRADRGMTQEDLGKLFHVTRQTVSNWENGKSLPDLQTLVRMSDQFHISLDILLKSDRELVRTIDRQRLLGTVRREKGMIDFLTGAGTGLLASCLFAPDSMRKTVTIFLALGMIAAGWYKKARQDKAVLTCLEDE